jgi:MFS family permease
MTRIFNEQSKPEPKWQAISSSILGIISILPVATILIYYLYELKAYYPILPEACVRCLERYEIPRITGRFGLLWLIGGGWLFPVAGFVLGIMGLKYSKKKLAITGIVLSIVGFAVCAFLYYIFSWLFSQ